MYQPPCDKCGCRLVKKRNENGYEPCRCLSLNPYDYKGLKHVRSLFDKKSTLSRGTIQRLFDTIEMTQMHAGESRRAMFDALPYD